MNKTICDRCAAEDIRYTPELGNGLMRISVFHLCWKCHQKLERMLATTMKDFMVVATPKPRRRFFTWFV